VKEHEGEGGDDELEVVDAGGGTEEDAGHDGALDDDGGEQRIDVATRHVGDRRRAS